MRCTLAPHSGHGWPKRPCTAMPSRNAVTFCGKSSPVSRRSRSLHFDNVVVVASNSRAISSRRSRLAHLPGELGISWIPVQPAGNHQVQDEVKLITQPPDDALAQPENLVDLQSFHGANRRIDRAQQEWACQLDALQHLSQNPRPQ